MLLSLIQRALALASLVLLGLGVYFVWSWWRLYQLLDPPPGVELDTQVWRLWVGGLLLAFSFLGRTPMLWLLGRRGEDADRFRRERGEMFETESGARLKVERDGPAEAPVIVFVHAWGMDAGVWWEARRTLSERFGVIVFDLAGLGRSRAPKDGRICLSRFADDLASVVREAAPRKLILVGHSIGGMTVMTFCRRYPEMLNRHVVGIVLENTTADNPARTTVLGEALYAARPVLRPLMRLDVWLQPLTWAVNWQSYLSGSTHLAMRLGGFGSRPTRAQLEQVARAVTTNSPAVQAKGNIAMMDWRIDDELRQINVPALVFIGGRDIVTVPQAGETIAGKLPRARPHRLGEAGHLGPIELADEYNQAIARFADDLFTRGAQDADGRLSRKQPPREGGIYGRWPDEPRPFG